MMVLASEKVVQQARLIAEADPHGFTITLVSIALVFLVLLMLCCLYTLSGEYFKHRHSMKTRLREITRESKLSDEEIAAATYALYLYRQEKQRHDRESGVITIRRGGA